MEPVSSRTKLLPSMQFELLGNSLAVIEGIASKSQAQRVLESYQLVNENPPVFWPQKKDVPIYHNRAVWPFVTAYGIKAARKAEHWEFMSKAFLSLIKGYRSAGSNQENFELTSMATYYKDGNLSGPVINSPPTLVDLGLSFTVLRDLLGIELSQRGIMVKPTIPSHCLNPSRCRKLLQINRLSIGSHTVTMRFHLPSIHSKVEGVTKSFIEPKNSSEWQPKTHKSVDMIGRSLSEEIKSRFFYLSFPLNLKNFTRSKYRRSIFWPLRRKIISLRQWVRLSLSPMSTKLCKKCCFTNPSNGGKRNRDRIFQRRRADA